MSEQRRAGGPRRGSMPGQPSGGEGGFHVDLGLGDLFKGLGGFLDLLGQMTSEGKSEVSRSGEIRGPSGVRGVYGLSIKTGLGGTPVVERFGNIRSTEHGPKVSEVREPLVDVFDEEGHILVVAEMPGVAEKDVQSEAKDDILVLSAKSGDREYAKEILLPALVDPASLQQSYQNGILEIRLAKANPSQPKG